MKTATFSLLALALLATSSPRNVFADGGKGQAVLAVETAARISVQRTLKKKKLQRRAIVSSSVTQLRSRKHRGRVDVDCKVVLTVVASKGKRLGARAITLEGVGAVRSVRRSVAAAEKSCVTEVAQQLVAYKVAPAVR